MIETTVDVPHIRALVGESALWRDIRHVPTTGSTNADLSAAAHRGEPAGQVLLASEQTAGRGRLTRQWASPAGSSISMSVLLAPAQPAARWGWLSLLTGVAVADALDELAPPGVSVAVKWPNDVLVDGGKVCGILSERVEHPAGVRAVVGLGVNLTLTRDELPVPTATSLALAGFETTVDDVVAGILRHLERHHREWERAGTLRDAYRERCASIGAPLTITAPGRGPIGGTGHDVDDEGCLQVRTAAGLETFAVGDVVHARLA